MSIGTKVQAMAVVEDFIYLNSSSSPSIIQVISLACLLKYFNINPMSRQLFLAHRFCHVRAHEPVQNVTFGSYMLHYVIGSG